ncbi:MAG TPA: PhoH family protein, partial [Acidimicrobiales bacterium]
LAFMRGRTLNQSFIILDEAQNATPEQMKMFLTRIGFGSRAVVTADMTQVDLPTGRSGMTRLERILDGIEGLSFIRLGSKDVVRHRIVQDIVDAYDRADAGDRAPDTHREAAAGAAGADAGGAGTHGVDTDIGDTGESAADRVDTETGDTGESADNGDETGAARGQGARS